MRTRCALSVDARAGRTTTSKVEISHRLPREPILRDDLALGQLMLLGDYSAVAIVGAVVRWPNHRGIVLTVAVTPRTFGATNQWRDGEALFVRCALWCQSDENIAESLRREDRVIVRGRGCSSGLLRPARITTAPDRARCR